MKLAYIKQRDMTGCGITTTTLCSTYADFWYNVNTDEFYSEPMASKGLGCTMLKFKKI